MPRKNKKQRIKTDKEEVKSAAINGDAGIVHSFLKNGGDANIKCSTNDIPCTLLHFAAAYGHLTVAASLLTHKAERDVVDGKGRTPLFLASQMGKIDMVEFLLSWNVDVSVCSERGFNAATIASAYGNTEILKCFVKLNNFNVDGKDDNDFTPLHQAANNGHYETMRYLLEEGGASPLTQNKHAESPLNESIRRNDARSVALLLKHNADPNAVDFEGNVPIMFAIRQGFGESMEVLLKDTRTDVNRPNRYGVLPLHLALIHRRDKIARMLYTHNDIKLNKPGFEGVTALHLVAERGDAVLLKELLDLGAKPDIPNKDKDTAFDIAQKKGHLGMIREFCPDRYGSAPSIEGASLPHPPSDMKDVFSTDEELYKFLLEEGIVEDNVSIAGTPSHDSVEMKAPTVESPKSPGVKLSVLLEDGSRKFSIDLDMGTPLNGGQQVSYQEGSAGKQRSVQQKKAPGLKKGA